LSLSKRHKHITNQLKELKMRTYFDTESLKVGMIVEYDYSGGLNSGGVDYYLTKVTKTYVEGYSIIGHERGNIKKITKPKQINYAK